MSFTQFLGIPVFIAFQAFTMMLLAPFIPGNSENVGGPGLMTWVAFQAWAMYFLAGCNVPMALKTFAGYVGGIVASIAIFELHNILARFNSASTPWGLYLAVFIVVIAVICAEKLPGFNFIPSWFIGAGVFFGLMTFGKKPEADSVYLWYGKLAAPELIACAMGLVYGHITVVFRKAYEAKFAAAPAGSDAATA